MSVNFLEKLIRIFNDFGGFGFMEEKNTIINTDTKEIIEITTEIRKKERDIFLKILGYMEYSISKNKAH